jgi:hypothetical protein
MSEQQKVQQQQSAAAANADYNDDDNYSIAEGWSLETSGTEEDGNSADCDLVNKLKLNMDALQVR